MLIHPDQSGFVPGRRIEEAVNKVLLVQKHGLSQQQCIDNKRIQVSIDFNKAYDSLNRQFLWRVLHQMNFPVSFLKIIQQTYNNTRAKFMVNGFGSRWFSTSSGIRQGCPLAPLLFILAMEIILNQIRTNTSIQGFKARSEKTTFEIRGVGFVDDLLVTLNKAKQLPTLLRLLDIFGKFSGLISNSSKCNGFWLDQESGPPIFHGIKFLQNTETTRYLGILI